MRELNADDVRETEAEVLLVLSSVARSLTRTLPDGSAVRDYCATWGNAAGRWGSRLILEASEDLPQH